MYDIITNIIMTLKLKLVPYNLGCRHRGCETVNYRECNLGTFNFLVVLLTDIVDETNKDDNDDYNMCSFPLMTPPSFYHIHRRRHCRLAPKMMMSGQRV